MKFIFIYGPPAVGKLTIAKELSKLTNYKIVHGHLVNDLIASIFSHGTKQFLKYNHKTRLMLFDLACKEKVNGLIFTFGYHNDNDPQRAKDIERVIKKNKGKIYFVKLTADKKILEERTITSDRKKFGKIKTKKLIREVLKNKNYFKKMDFKPTLEIDNSKLSAKNVAKKIKSHYKI
tara:strand:+ start:929 stop:1459 length:531 start_codon:yes stop_codon:yes gene_type:complete